MKNVSTGQIMELIGLRHDGAPVEAALSDFVNELLDVRVQECDLADLIGWVLGSERSRGPQGDQVQEIIACLTSGGVAGKMADQREAMAKRLWDRGFGRDPAVKAKNFKAYLYGIPQIPAGLIKDDSDLPLLSLADPRPGLQRSCKLLGIQYEELGYSDDSAEPFDQNFPIPTTPFWFRHDDGRKNRNRRPDHCRDELAGDIIAGSAMEGIFAYAHHPNIVVESEHVIDLPRTVRRGDRVVCACFEVWEGQTRLRLYRGSVVPYPRYGSLYVRRK